MDLSRLRAIVRSSRDARSADGGPPHLRELTYEPDTGGYEATIGPERVGDILGGRPLETRFGACVVVERRYEGDRRHGGILIGDCELPDWSALRLLDRSLTASAASKVVFIDLETTGLSGGAGTVAFLVGCGYFDAGAFQVRQFLLTSYAAERALLSAVADCFEGADLIVSFNGKTFDLPVMETRWSFHRIQMPLDGVAHLDMLHPARRLWRYRESVASGFSRAHRDAGGCRLTTLERMVFGLQRVGDVPGFEIPARFFQFLRSGNPRPLEPVLEHNRLDLVSLAVLMACAARLAADGADACRDAAEALALGRIFERGGATDRAEACYRRAAAGAALLVRAESLHRLALKCRRERRHQEAADVWRELLSITEGADSSRGELAMVRQVAAEALAIHHEHRARNLPAAREVALFALGEAEERNRRRADGLRYRLARLERKMSKPRPGEMFNG